MLTRSSEVLAANPATRLYLAIRSVAQPPVTAPSLVAHRKPKLTVSQYEVIYANRWIAAGRCKLCGRPRNLYARLCDYHQIRQRHYDRKWCVKAGKPKREWAPGVKGRTPYEMRPWPEGSDR